MHLANLLLSWFILTLALLATSRVVPGLQVKNLGGAAIAAAVYGVLNWLLGALFFAVLGVLTLGLGFLLAFLTRWVVNALLLRLTSLVTDHLKVRGFGTAMIASLVMSLVTIAVDWVLR